jgi:hypothetical protein
MDLLREWSMEWYALLSQFGAITAKSVMNLSDQWNIPVITAFLLGLVGATSPCQLTCNVSALAYVSRDLGNRRETLIQTFAFVLGKVLVYSLIGGVVIYLGLQMSSAYKTVPAKESDGAYHDFGRCLFPWLFAFSGIAKRSDK